MLRQVREVPPRKNGYRASEPWFAKDLRDFVRMGYDAAELLPPEGVAKSKSWADSTACSVNRYAKKKGLPVRATKRKDIVYIERKADQR